MKRKDWSSAYRDENVEVRHIKTKKDLERESALLKTERLTKCIRYEVNPKYHAIFYARLCYGRD